MYSGWNMEYVLQAHTYTASQRRRTHPRRREALDSSAARRQNMAIVFPSLPFSSSDSSGDIDLATDNSPSPLLAPTPSVESVAAMAAGWAVVLLASAVVAAAATAARRFLKEDRRFGPELGGRNRDASLTPPFCRDTAGEREREWSTYVRRRAK